MPELNQPALPHYLLTRVDHIGHNVNRETRTTGAMTGDTSIKFEAPRLVPQPPDLPPYCPAPTPRSYVRDNLPYITITYMYMYVCVRECMYMYRECMQG